MTDGSSRADFRVVGAVTALVLDVGALALAIALVMASVSPAWALVLAGMVGLVVGPPLGWRYGPSAANGRPDAWRSEALLTLLIVEASLVCGWVFQAVVSQRELGPRELAAVVASTIVFGFFWCVVLTCVVGLPLGLAWVLVLQNASVRDPRAGRPADPR